MIKCQRPEYLEAVREAASAKEENSNIVFSPLGYQGQMIGGAYIGIDYILKKSLEK